MRDVLSPAALAVRVLTGVLLLVGLVGAPAAASAPVADAAESPEALDTSGRLLPAGVPAPPEVPAASWLVADVDTGEVLAAQSPRAPLAPASTLKLLTALALAPELEPDATWTAVHEDAAIDGSKVGVVPGSVYTVEDLMHALLLGSGNDAANALAGMVGGMGAATSRMQEVAEQLGAEDTVVRNTSGLDAEGQVSTAVDLALIGRAVLADPELAALVRTTRYQFPGEGTTFGPERPRFEVANHNRLLYGYEGALGLKNGYTRAAGGSFVGAVERDGRRYLVTLLKSEGSTSQQARALLDWAVVHGPAAEPVATLPAPTAAEEARRTEDTEPVDADDVEPAPEEDAGDAEPPVGEDARSDALEDARGAPAASESDLDATGGEDGDGRLGWLQLPLAALVVMAVAVALLRARVLLRRRRRARRGERLGTVSRGPEPRGREREHHR